MIPNQGENVFKLDKLPSNWKACLLVDAVDIKGGSQPPKKVFKTELEQGYIRLVQIRDYKSDRYLTYVPINSTKKFCTTEDIMIGRYGPPVFQILKGIEGAYNVALMKANPLSNMDRDFLYYLLLSPPVQKLVIGNSQRTAGQTGVNLKLLNNCIIPLPPLEQQKKIAAILDAADTYRQKTKALITKYDALTQSLFLDMFGDTVSNPKGWETKTIEQLVKKQKYSLKRGPFGGALKKEIFVKDGYLVYEQYHALNNDFSMVRYFIDEKKYKELIGFAVNPKDIIISCSGVYLGKLAIIPENAREGIINQALLKVTLDESKIRNDFFVFHFTQQNFKQKYFDSNRGAGVPNFPPMKVFKQFPFISPPIELQNKFAERIQAIEVQKTQAQASLVQAEDLFNSLLQKAFKGELNS